MLSTPPAKPILISLLLILLAILIIDCNPLEHSLFTAEIGTFSLMPAKN